MACAPSCGTTCSTCEPTTQWTASSDTPTLIKYAKKNWNKEKHDPQWDVLFNQIAFGIAKENAQAIKPLLALFEEHGPTQFLAVCEKLHKINLVGIPIWWAFEYCQEESDQFEDLILKQDQKLLDFVNQKIEFHSCFAGNEKYEKLLLKTPKTKEQKTKEEKSETQQKNFLNEVKSFIIQFLFIFAIGAISLFIYDQMLAE